MLSGTDFAWFLLKTCAHFQLTFSINKGRHCFTPLFLFSKLNMLSFGGGCNLPVRNTSFMETKDLPFLGSPADHKVRIYQISTSTAFPGKQHILSLKRCHFFALPVTEGARGDLGVSERRALTSHLPLAVKLHTSLHHAPMLKCSHSP